MKYIIKLNNNRYILDPEVNNSCLTRWISSIHKKDASQMNLNLCRYIIVRLNKRYKATIINI